MYKHNYIKQWLLVALEAVKFFGIFYGINTLFNQTLSIEIQAKMWLINLFPVTVYNELFSISKASGECINIGCIYK